MLFKTRPTAYASILETTTAYVCVSSATWMPAHRPCVPPMLATETLCARGGVPTWMPSHRPWTALMLAT